MKDSAHCATTMTKVLTDTSEIAIGKENGAKMDRNKPMQNVKTISRTLQTDNYVWRYRWRELGIIQTNDSKISVTPRIYDHPINDIGQA
jgi:hypothetical protein